MIVNDLLRAWEEGIAVASAPVLRRRDEVSQADLGQHASVLRIKTHVQTGRGDETLNLRCLRDTSRCTHIGLGLPGCPP